MTLSEDIQAQIDKINTVDIPDFNSRMAQWNNETCFNSLCSRAHAAKGHAFAKEIEERNKTISSLTEQLATAKEKELLEIKIESNLDIPQSIVTPLGEPLEPISTQMQKLENKGLILAAGLVAAAILLK